jgi:hypothetical protein
VTVDLALLDPDPRGLTTKEEADDLNALEDDLGAAVGTEAAHFGRETGRGRRVLHFFAPADEGLKTKIETWASRHRERDARVTWRDDPRWEARARFL